MIPKQILIKVCLLTCFVAACDSSSNGAAEKEVATAEPEAIQKPESRAERLEARQQLAASEERDFDDLEKVPVDDTTAARGEVPSDLMAKIISDLAIKVGAQEAEIEVAQAESLIWNDGSLGCGKPDQSYTQAQVPGYRVILRHANQSFDYRASERGFFMLCEQPAMLRTRPGDEPPLQ